MVKIPTTKLRSDCGNHSAVAFVARGKLVASVNPSNTRNEKKLRKPRPKACNMVAMLHAMTASENDRRVPSRSMTGPHSNCPKP